MSERTLCVDSVGTLDTPRYSRDVDSGQPRLYHSSSPQTPHSGVVSDDTVVYLISLSS